MNELLGFVFTIIIIVVFGWKKIILNNIKNILIFKKLNIYYSFSKGEY